MDVSKNSGTPKSSILIWFSILNHPFWGTPMFGFNILAYALLGACLWSRFHRLPGFPRQKLLCRKRPECHRAVFWHWDDYPHLGLHIAEIDQICWWKTCGTCGTCVGREGIEKIPKWERCNSMGNMRICMSYMGFFSMYVHVKTKPRFVLTKSMSSAKCSFRSLCGETETYKSYRKMSSWKEHLVGGWINPIEKYEWNWIISPRIRGQNKKYLSCHHLEHVSGSGKLPWQTVGNSELLAVGFPTAPLGLRRCFLRKPWGF